MNNPITRVAAVQMEGRRGDIAYNLGHVKTLALEAISQGVKVVSLPEFFTTTIVLHDDVKGCSLPAGKNDALDLLIELATQHQVLIGGSYLEKRGEDVFNCYALVQPDGSVSKHDKDIPTMVENAFYIGGKTDGFHQTSVGRVGTAMCWETIRTQTVHRLKGRVDFLMTGSHWWTIASNWPIKFGQTDPLNREIMRATPGRLAQLLGVPNIHAAHCSRISGDCAWLPGGRGRVPFESQLIGETQITDSQGNIIKRLTAEEGPGVIVADIDLREKQPPAETPSRFWIPDLPINLKFAWTQQRWATEGLYQQSKRLGRL